MCSALSGCRSDASTPTADPQNDRQIDSEKRDASTAAPARIVSLTPSATEVIAALGAADRLVGVDNYSAFPASVAALPKVGDFLSPRLESIVRLTPDLVVLDEVQGRANKALTSANIETVAVKMHSLRDLRRSIASIGAALGEGDRAESLVAEIDRAVAKATELAGARSPSSRPRVLLIIDRSPGSLRGLVGAGPGSFLHELVVTAGAVNALDSGSVRYPKISPEQVLRAAPDIVLDASQAGGALAAWSTLDIPATKNARVHHLPQSYFLSPSPRVSMALTDLSRLLFPGAIQAP